ncbi:MAG TPA: SH3 domain-containing protein [Chitinophagaceae bacterium]
MALQDKYKTLIDTAKSAGVSNLQVREQNGVLYIDGDAPSGRVKDQLWDSYGKIDPDFRGGDLVLNVDAKAEAGTKVKVVTKSSNLNIRKGPGTDQPIVGKAAHDEIITLVSKSNDQWWLVRTPDGEEGYSYAQYLEPVN